MGILERCSKWKARLTPLEEICIDMGVLFTAWMLIGVAFYYFCDEHWDATYAWFFAVNVGLGVGYGKYMLTNNSTKYFTVVFVMVGTSLIMGGLVCFFDLLTQRTKAASFTRTTYVTFCQGHVRISNEDVKLLLFGLGYLVMLGVGVAIGYIWENLDTFSDALLFSVTNYTTSGLIRPRMSKGSLIATTVSLIIGIPFNALFWGEVASRYFARIYRKKTCVDRGARKKTRSRAPAPPRRAPMKLRPARAIFSLCLSLDRYLEEKEATEVGSGDDASDASGSAGGAAAVPAALDDLDALAAGSEPGSPAAGAAAIADDPYVLFLHTELVKSGLVTKTHLGWLQSMYEVQQVSGGES